MWGDDNGPNTRRIDIRGAGEVIKSEKDANEVLATFRRAVSRVNELSRTRDGRRPSDDVREELALERKVALAAKDRLLEWIPRAGKKSARHIQVQIEGLSNLISPPEKLLKKAAPQHIVKQESKDSMSSLPSENTLSMVATYGNGVPRSLYGDDALGDVYMDIVHLQDVCLMMAQQVELQGQTLNTIEDHITQTNNDLHEGNKFLVSASKLQVGSTALGVVGAGLLLGPVGALVMGIKSGVAIGALAAVAGVAAKQMETSTAKKLEAEVDRMGSGMMDGMAPLSE